MKLSGYLCQVLSLASMLVSGAQAQMFENRELFNDASRPLFWRATSVNAPMERVDDALRFAIPQQQAPTCADYALMRPIGPGIRLHRIELSVRAEGAEPSMLFIKLRNSGSGRAWLYRCPTPELDRDVAISVDVTFDAGWTLGSIRHRHLFDEDVTNIDELSLHVRRGGSTAAQPFFVNEVIISAERLSDDADWDMDGLPDGWEIAEGLDPEDPRDAALDLDGDGMSSYQEWRAGTRPRDPNSFLRLHITPIPGSRESDSDAGVLLEWSGRKGRQYEILQSTDLNHWFGPLHSVIEGHDGIMQAVDADLSSSNVRFYRIFIRDDP